MKQILILVLLLSSMSSHSNDDQFLKEKMRVFEHENKGCPINSICSKENGARIIEWERILEKPMGPTKEEDKTKFFKNTGLPLHFLAKRSAANENDVVLVSSRCRNHHPKNPSNSLYKGTIFTNTIPNKSELMFDKIHVFEDKEVLSFTVGFEARPLFMKQGRLFFLEDFIDNFYQTSIDKNGKIYLENLPQRLFGQAQSKRVKEGPCPENAKEKEDRYSSSFCQKIWDIDTNKMKTIQLYWSCP